LPPNLSEVGGFAQWIHHFAFEVGTIDEMRAIKERLEKAGVEGRGLTDHHFI
jgi:hypothetical protein